MHRRRWLVALTVLAATAACGDGGGDGDVEAERALALDVDASRLVTGAPVDWRFVVTNQANAPVVQRIPSGQDAELLLRDGEEVVYRWSTGRVFTQAVREITLAPGEVRRFTLAEEALDVAAGVYELEASVTGEPAPPPVTRTVTVARKP